MKLWWDKFLREYLQSRLITRDQRLFNDQVPAAEALKWDIDQVHTPSKAPMPPLLFRLS